MISRSAWIALLATLALEFSGCNGSKSISTSPENWSPELRDVARDAKLKALDRLAEAQRVHNWRICATSRMRHGPDQVGWLTCLRGGSVAFNPLATVNMEGVRELSISPDGASVALVRESPSQAGTRSQVLLQEVRGGSAQPLMPPTPGKLYGVAWSADSRRLYFLLSDSEIPARDGIYCWSHDASTEPPRRDVFPPQGPPQYGTRVVVGSDPGTLFLTTRAAFTVRMDLTDGSFTPVTRGQAVAQKGRELLIVREVTDMGGQAPPQPADTGRIERNFEVVSHDLITQQDRVLVRVATEFQLGFGILGDASVSPDWSYFSFSGCIAHSPYNCMYPKPTSATWIGELSQGTFFPISDSIVSWHGP